RAVPCRVCVLAPLDVMLFEEAVTLAPQERREVVALIDAPPRTLSGRVLDAEGRAIEGATVGVEIESGGFAPSVSATTSIDGAFEITGLRAGRVRVTAQRH